MSGQCTAIFGSPGSAPRAISSMLGWVAAVSATESPSQPRPPFIQRMCTNGSSVVVMGGHLLGVGLCDAQTVVMLDLVGRSYKTEKSGHRTDMSVSARGVRTVRYLARFSIWPAQASIDYAGGSLKPRLSAQR